MPKTQHFCVNFYKIWYNTTVYHNRTQWYATMHLLASNTPHANSSHLTKTLLFAALFATSAYANTPDDRVITQNTEQQQQQQAQKTLTDIAQKQQLAQQKQQLEESQSAQLAHNAPVNIDETWTTEEIYAHLQKNPDAFESLLQRSVVRSDVVALKKLLPAYEKYTNKDPAIIDWGTAIIALNEGNAKTAVSLYRKLNAQLPTIRLLRVQLASALYQNKQTKAAKDELQKLLQDSGLTDKDRQEINSYITAMNRLDKWTYSLNLSFTQDKNLEDSPAIGTVMSSPYGTLSYNTPHESGTGVRYGVGVSKRWSYDNQSFLSFGTDVSGTHYWDNKKYDDIYASAKVGVGFQSASAELEIAPTIAKSWYAGGASAESDKLKDYTESYGLTISGSKWLNNRLMYQNSLSFTNLSYESPYQSNDGKIYSMTNGLFYATKPTQSFSLNWNLSQKDGVRESDSYKRSGVNLGWNNTWRYGLSTSANLSLASKKYEGVNFANIKRHNHEYQLGLSLWKRDFSLFGLTPRLNMYTKQTVSNYPFDESSESNANIVFGKTF